MNVKNYKTVICTAAAVAFLGAAFFCGFKIYSHYQQIDEQTEAFVEIAEVVENVEPEEEPPRDKDIPVSEGEDILAKYKELYLQNEDMVGWIAIDGTSINYPVMQSRNSPNFYLKHSFEKEYPRGLRHPHKRQSGYLRTPHQRRQDVRGIGRLQIQELL